MSVEAYRSIQLRRIELLSSRRRSALTISLFETRALDGITERVLCGSLVIQEMNQRSPAVGGPRHEGPVLVVARLHAWLVGRQEQQGVARTEQIVGARRQLQFLQA